MARINKRAMAKIMPTIKAPAVKTEDWDIWKSHQWQHIPKRLQDLNITWNIFDGAFITYDLALRKFKYVAWTTTGWEANTASNIWTWHWVFDSKLWVDLRFKSLLAWTWIVIVQNWDDLEIRSSWITSCTEVISCVENATNITLQNLEVTWDTLLNNLSFVAWAIIDYTNSTSTWVQNFDSNYIANYDWSTINYTNTNINNVWVNITYNNTSTVNLPTNTYVNWQQIATQADVAWLSNWKQTVRIATTNAADVTAYTYVPGNEPTWLVWTWVTSAPTIDWNTLNDWDRILIKDAWDARWNGIFVYDATQQAFIRSSDADNAPNTWEVASMMVWIHDWDTNYWKIFREIHTSPIVLWTDTVDMTPFIISVVAWETNTSSNEWTWVWLAMAKVGVNLPFKTLIAWANIAITDNGNEVEIASTWGVTDCAAVISCVENATTLDLTNVDVTLWDVLNVGNTTYSNTATIDYTNSTTTGEQNFDNSYIANYNWSTINNTNVTENNNWWTVNNVDQTINNDSNTEINNNWTTINNDNTTENNTNVTENYDNTSVTNNNGNTINNNSTTTNNNGTTENYTNNSVTNYDSTTEVNMEWDTNIENLVVNNITLQGGWYVVVNWSWRKQTETTPWATNMVLVDTPLWDEEWLLVFKQDSWLHWTATDDYTYDVLTKTITFPALVTWDKIEVRYMVWNNVMNWGNIVVNWEWIRQNESTAWATEIALTDIPVSWEPSIFVFKQDSWLHWTATDDYTYDSVNNKITFPALASWAKVEIRYMVSSAATILPSVNTVEVATSTYNANAWDYVLVTNNTTNTDVNLPDATTCNWSIVKIKKFTWEDTLTVNINPVTWQLIDWYTWASMSLNRTMYTFTAINGNWYLWD